MAFTDYSIAAAAILLLASCDPQRRQAQPLEGAPSGQLVWITEGIGVVPVLAQGVRQPVLCSYVDSRFSALVHQGQPVALVAAFFDDGTVISSPNPQSGGPPYQTRLLTRERVASLASEAKCMIASVQHPATYSPELAIQTVFVRDGSNSLSISRDFPFRYNPYGMEGRLEGNDLVLYNAYCHAMDECVAMIEMARRESRLAESSD